MAQSSIITSYITEFIRIMIALLSEQLVQLLVFLT